MHLIVEFTKVLTIMKRKILFLLSLFLVLVTNAVAENFTRIAEDGKEWLVYYQVVSPQAPLISITMKIDGDTIINGNTYKKLYTYETDEYGNVTQSVSYCHQEGDVFYKNGKRMFDFGLQEGDIFGITSNEILVVTQVSDTTLSDGISRKCLTMAQRYRETGSVESTVGPEVDKWIEGIGSLKKGIFKNSTLILGTKEELQSVSLNGEYIYVKEKDEQISSTPVIHEITVTPENPSIDEIVILEVELGIFMGNAAYKHQVDSIVGKEIYVSASYNCAWDAVAMFDRKEQLRIDKLDEGEYTLYYRVRGLNGTAPTEIDSTYTYSFKVSGANQLKFIDKELQIQAEETTILCTSPNAVKLDVYTMDALKVGEASFINGEAVVKVNKTPATYLYIVTYPDGRRESGKVMVK